MTGARALAGAVVTVGLLAQAVLANPARADETIEAFLARVEAAYAAPDPAAAMAELFHLEGVDAETRETYDTRLIPHLLRGHDAPTVGTEPVPDDFDPLYVLNGYEYRPNLAPLGYVVIDGTTKAVYGRRDDGRYYFVGTTRTAVNPDGPPDRMLQMMLVGQASPPVNYTGHFDVMQSNGKIKRMELEDNGHGNTTAIIMGQYIERCEVTNDSARGSLWLRLQEGEETVFDERIETPATRLSYRR